MSDQLKNQAPELVDKTDDIELAFVTTQVDELPGQIVAGHYEILSLLGTGGLGAVYRANHKLLKKTVAIKFLRQARQFDSTALQRFQREAQAAIGLAHQNIAGVQEFGVHDGMPFLVMELVDGEPLDKIIERDGALKPDRALTIFKQLLTALAYAHKKGVVHRDVKPENIIVSTNSSGVDQIKLIDFGIAKVMENEELVDITKTGEIFGTPHYMSPEQCRGQKISNRTDIYSAGCVAFEMLNGKPPFTGESTIDVILKHVNETPRILVSPENASGLERVIDRTLAKDPDTRYSSASEVLSELALIEAGKKPRKTFHLSKKVINRSIFGLIMTILISACALAAVIGIAGQERTIQSVSKVIRENPNSSDSYIERARLYAERSDYTAAIADLLAAEKLNPKDSEIFELKSWYERELGQDQQALDDAERAVKLRPDGLAGYVHRARANHQLKNYQATIHDIAKAIALDPTNQRGWFCTNYVTSSAAHMMLNHPQKALEDANKAIKYRPQITDKAGSGKIDLYGLSAFQARATANLKLKNYGDAVVDTDNALRIDPNNFELLGQKANALCGLRKFDDAIAAINKAIEISPSSDYLKRDRDLITKYKHQNSKSTPSSAR